VESVVVMHLQQSIERMERIDMAMEVIMVDQVAAIDGIYSRQTVVQMMNVNERTARKGSSASCWDTRGSY
jgi:hypothetical protein